MNTSTINSKIDTIIRSLFYALILFLPYSKAVIETAVVTSSVLWIIKHTLMLWELRVLKKSQNAFIADLWQSFRPASSPLNYGIAFFLLACIFSLVGSVIPGQSLRGFLTKTIEWFAVYLIVVEVFISQRQVYKALCIFVITSFIVGLDSVAQLHWLHRDIFFDRALIEGYRVTAAFDHSNVLGGFLVVAILVLIGLFFAGRDKVVRKIFIAAVFALLIWTLFHTFSRGAWMGATIAMLFFVVIVVGAKVRPVLRNILIILAIVIASLSAGQSFELKKQRNLVSNDIETAQWRLALWRESLFLIKERPFFGHGLNTFMSVMEKSLITTKNPLANGFSASYAHNCFLQIAVEVGIFGLSAFLGIMFLLFRQILFLPHWNSPQGQSQRMLIVGILAGLLGFLAHSAVDTNFYSLQLPVLFWYMTGLLISLDKQLRNQLTCVIK
ncbi:MAG: O-antigen ligase family protein [Candidatus Omnitrophica bacterium]|nr:O-antigen ligase family protein [Candidatus Omnitrophota bacterium]